MKTSIELAILIATFFAAIPARGANLEINIIPTVGCSLDSPNLTENQINIMAGLRNFSRVPDWTTAPSWRPFEYLKWPFLVSSTNTAFKLWFGSPNPAIDFGTGFANERGNKLDLCVTVFSRDGSSWQTKDLYYSITCSHPEIIPSALGNLVNFGATNQINFSDTAVGVDYGPSGSPIVYSEGEPPNTMIKDFHFIGPHLFVPVGRQSELEAARRALTQTGFAITFTVWHQAPNGTKDAERSLTLYTDSKLILFNKSGSLVFLLSGQPNLVYRIERSSDLGSGTWTTIQNKVTEGSWFTNSFLNSQSYFRAVTP